MTLVWPTSSPATNASTSSPMTASTNSRLGNGDGGTRPVHHAPMPTRSPQYSMPPRPHPQTQRLAAWGLIALFIAVFPANVSQALRKIPYGKAPLWLTWARLPLQAGLIAWAYAFT